jgi:hypothetical protein
MPIAARTVTNSTASAQPHACSRRPYLQLRSVKNKHARRLGSANGREFRPFSGSESEQRAPRGRVRVLGSSWIPPSGNCNLHVSTRCDGFDAIDPKSFNPTCAKHLPFACSCETVGGHLQAPRYSCHVQVFFKGKPGKVGKLVAVSDCIPLSP